MGFGIDHPMIAVKDLDSALKQVLALGFVHNQRQSHPWGTDNYLLLFPDTFIEIITIARPEQTSYSDANGFRFARAIEARLRYGDGVAMLALDSQCMAHDHALVEARGFAPWEPIEFKRMSHSRQGSVEMSVVLDILHDPSQPFLTQFLCHYPHPELLRRDPSDEYHPNQVSRLKAMWYISDNIQRDFEYYRLIHGAANIFSVNGGYRVATPKGDIWLLSPSSLKEHIPDLENVAEAPSRAVAISLETMDLNAAIAHWERNNVPYMRINEHIADIPASVLGGTVLRFEQCEDCLL
ncbi:hypothetical protein LMG33818_001840 [Halomonadaceae bacterium LMG 33818]|uniref:VOC family protein n=1 Tax=Cernens ardua TaxID=3402176 RepID=UPI003EDB70C2